jgi:speckle-type POZ protein
MADQWEISATMVAESEESSFVLKVPGYSRAKAVFRNCEYMATPPFSVGGHSFVLRYFPNGGSTTHFMSCSLVLASADAEDAKVNARLAVLDDVVPYVWPHVLSIDRRNGLCFGYSIYHMALEASRHLAMDDCLSIRYAVAVQKDIHGEETVLGDRFVVVPPSDLHLHLGDLLESMDGADVTFHVGREMFSAHRSVLAARSSVFKAELHGPMKEGVGDPIVIHEMEADVFKCLLHFIYTDTLPALVMADRDAAMASHLLVVADRYDVQRLKLICEHKLCSQVDANMVATTLALADQRNCRGLKEACLQFLASPSNLEAFKASDGFEHLKISCPSVVKELIASLLPDTMKAAKDIVMTL